jgi:drug/metabolite transporter (DMT)-like permease
MKESAPLLSAGAVGGFWRTATGLALIIAGDFTASLTINFYNSFLLRSDFDYPLVYSCLQQAATFATASLLIFGVRVAPANWAQAKALALQIVLLAFLRGTSIYTNNKSLEYISITLNKIIKASVPVFVMPLSLLLERKHYSLGKLCSLLILAAGTMLSSVSSSSTSSDNHQYMQGILLAFCSAAVGASSVVLGAILMGKNSGLGPISVMLYMSPCQVVMLSCIVPFVELAPFEAYVREQDSGMTALLLMIGALLAVAFNLMSYVQLQVARARC